MALHKLALACIGLVGATKTPWSAYLDDEAVAGATTPKLCPSPSGWHPCACIREVESGTKTEEVQDGQSGARLLRLHHVNGTIEDVPECPYARPELPRNDGGGPSDPCALDWAHAAPMEVFSRHNESIVSFTANYVVPDAPKTVASNILYYWIGLQDTTSAANPVVQPVLSFYPGSSPNNWYFESWNCCPAGHKIKGPSIPVAGPGAKLRGALTRDGHETTINSTDGSGNSSVLVVYDSHIVTSWNWVDITLETYSVTDCDQYSAGGAMIFEDMLILNRGGVPVTPQFASKPYIDGSYLNATESATFTGCCNGRFDTSTWGKATMTQN